MDANFYINIGVKYHCVKCLMLFRSPFKIYPSGT